AFLILQNANPLLRQDVIRNIGGIHSLCQPDTYNVLSCDDTSVLVSQLLLKLVEESEYSRDDMQLIWDQCISHAMNRDIDTAFCKPEVILKINTIETLLLILEQHSFASDLGSIINAVNNVWQFLTKFWRIHFCSSIVHLAISLMRLKRKLYELASTAEDYDVHSRAVNLYRTIVGNELYFSILSKCLHVKNTVLTTHSIRTLLHNAHVCPELLKIEDLAVNLQLDTSFEFNQKQNGDHECSIKDLLENTLIHNNMLEDIHELQQVLLSKSQKCLESSLIFHRQAFDYQLHSFEKSDKESGRLLLLEKNLMSCKTEKINLTNDITDLQHQLQKDKERLLHVSDENDANLQKLTIQNNEIDSLRAEIANYQQLVNELKAKLSFSEESNKDKVHTLTIRIEELTKQLTETQSELETAERDRDDFERTIDELSQMRMKDVKENECLASKIEELYAHLSKVREDLTVKETEITRLSSELSKYVKLLDAIKGLTVT
ncbi:hypothetical protein GJ496_003535, partial [Pomphorhynchus laevis]